MQFYTGNRYLSYAQMKVNAAYLWTYWHYLGWTIEAAAAMLGNMQKESTINPGIWQGLKEGNMSGGFGLVQWTSAYKYRYWCAILDIDPAHMLSAIDRIETEYAVDNGTYTGDESYIFAYSLDQWSGGAGAEFGVPFMSFAEFKYSTATPENLAMMFACKYERSRAIQQDPYGASAIKRGELARYWYNYILTVDVGGIDPPDPTPPNPPYLPSAQGMPLYYYIRRRYRT